MIPLVGAAKKNWRPFGRLRYWFLITTIFGGSIVMLTTVNISNDYYQILLRDTTNFTQNRNSSDDSFTIRTEGCIIPALKPLGEEIKKYVNYPTSIKPCPDSKLSLLQNNRTHIWVRNENKEYYNVTSYKKFSCCYKAFYRPKTVNDVTSSRIDDRVEYSECKVFTDVIQVSDEFVTVYCEGDNNKVYQQYYLFALEKESRLKVDDNDSYYNVIIMGIDAVSRLNFHRTMPETLKILKSKDAVELLGYNKVGDNTFPNLIPMLMGKSVQELKTTCQPNKQSTFDNCPFVWEWFTEAGYYTAFGEDTSSLGTFNYLKPGFMRSPTDYYIHTFMHEAEHNMGINKDFNSYLCMNDKLFYKVLLDYMENLTLMLSSSKLFGVFWETTMSHDYVNYPMLMDKDYADLLKRLDANNYLEKTILFLVSDHGIRWGDVRHTNQGRLEERLPFVYILTPQNFRNKYNQAFKNLQLNSGRLTTPYNLHATLQDLIDLRQIENKMIEQRTKSPVENSKGNSLFLPVPENRTCSQAYIDDHWCSCHRGTAMSTKSIEALEIAEKLVVHINMLLYNYAQCAKLKLIELIEITKMEVFSTEKDKIDWQEYLVMIRTAPGNAVFEGTLRHNGREWSLSGTVSRLNLYGDQSRCINNDLLKLYCFCQ